ncbi:MULTISPECIES: thiol-disulfide oxidoreductase DCC family protein [Neobacillus]|uniref:Thiol-disulfide oxidoreductase DCC family protein n=1 Tax=Neobacillus citreus TaxID=2833578 RepID=A0A942Y5Z0_9BACI|nr:thiol-disulfide oxidoreductase DCC family protein [Neobacillus citreus]MCH6265500.1 thiol-disulfide oxidoreductase DCC family protein [Neobacillus citreus]
MERIILYDGVCNLCNKSVQFIIKRDSSGQFKFASQQGVAGQNLLKKFTLPPKMNSFVLIENEKIYLESTAVLKVCKDLSGAWRLLAVLFVIPLPIRDRLYKTIASNRYKWFGKTESCMLPKPEWKNRFLD